MNPVYYVTVRHDGDDPTARHEPIRYDHFVRMLLKPDTIRMEGLHIILGLVGEWMEFCIAATPEDELEEFGDLEFYMQAVCNHFGITEGELHYENFRQIVQYELLADLIDFAKKKYIYGQDIPNTKIIPALAAFRKRITRLEQEVGFPNRQEILQANADKLSKRYKQLVFTTAESAARADKQA